MLCRDYVGKQVRLLTTLQTKGGEKFPRGRIMVVSSTHRGLFELRNRRSRKGFYPKGIRKVRSYDFELVE